MTQKIKVGIVGGTGYTGAELLRILYQHPAVSLQCITSRAESGRPVWEIFPSLYGQLQLHFTDPDVANLQHCDVVFFATPNGTAMQIVPQLLDRGCRVIDLAADFRLQQADVWQKWYGQPHACPDLLQHAVYGLPEINREKIRHATLIANPGCYPTAISLGLLPLLETGKNQTSWIADAKSGISGAGKKIEVNYLFTEASENFSAYAVNGHRHEPEIAQILHQVSGANVDLTFVPHLTPMIRGMFASLYGRSELSEEAIRKLYRDRFESEAFVEVLPEGMIPQTKSVRGSNRCQISVHKKREQVIIFSAIDNLNKGASGQAVQNMNIMFGLSETEGLQQLGFAP